MSTLSPIQIAVTLQDVALFGDCTAEQLVRLAAIARQRRLGAGERVYARGEAPDALYCVVEGEVELAGVRGRRRVGPGGAFGVLAILADRLRDEEARAAAPSLALVLDAEDFFDLLANNVDIVKALFRSLLRRADVAVAAEALAEEGAA